VPATRLREEQAHLRPLPRAPYVPLVTVGRRITRDGFISYNGNDYSVPDGLATQGTRAVDVRATLTELRLFLDERLVATHPLLEGRGARRLDPGHRPRSASRPDGGPPPLADVPAAAAGVAGVEVERRALSVYEQVLP